jgi:lysyl-tRNA synthetase, class II
MSEIPYRFERTASAGDLHKRWAGLSPGAETGETASVAGRIVLKRTFGKLIFATLSDRSGRIQIMADSSRLGEEEFSRLATLDLGDMVGAAGEVVTTKKGELSVRVDSFVLLAKARRPLPDKWHGLVDIEQRSRQRHLDLIVNEESRRVMLTRSQVLAELRRQFEARDYIEVETPILLIEATGALARPFVTHHQALDTTMQLRIATELYLKRLIVGGLEKVFEIGRIFRNEGVDATHNPEFTMLESYEAYADYGDIMKLVEEVVAATSTAVQGSTRITFGGRQVDLTPPYRREPFMELVAKAVGEEITFDRPLDDVQRLAREHGVQPRPEWGIGKIAEALYDQLVEHTIWDPVYVIDHPKEISPLAREHRADPNLVERFELVIAGHEYANAFSELIDPLDQRSRFEAQLRARAAGDEEAHPVDEDFIAALEYGMPPTGGLGIGVDRLVMLLTDTHHIRDVILFPTMRPFPPPGSQATIGGGGEERSDETEGAKRNRSGED